MLKFLNRKVLISLEIESGQSVRMVGINTPEIGKKGYLEAKAYLAGLIDEEVIQLEIGY